MTDNKLVRPVESGKIAGVCVAYANFLGIDVTLVRLLFVGMLLFFFSSIWVYLISWVVIPKENLDL